MALQAGRYGVTKAQLLKIKKLPMNTIKLIEDLIEKYNSLGSAAEHDATTTITSDSTDLPTGGAVYDLVGWGNKNLADVSKSEVGTAWNSSFATNRARLVIPCEGNTTYTLSINGTDTIDLIYVVGTDVVPSPLPGEAFSESLTITTSASNKYIVVGFNKTDITMADIEALKLQCEVGTTATTYEPYHASVEESKYNRSEANVLGTKNLLDNIATSYERNGITWTVNSDGTIKANGTATAHESQAILTSQDLLNLLNTYGDLILTGCPSGGGDNTYQMFVNASGVYEYDRGEGLLLSKNKTYLSMGVQIQIRNGYTANNVVFKPMLRLASDTDPTYQPYAQTNRELTVNKADNSVIAPVEDGATASQAYSAGRGFMHNGEFRVAKSGGIASGATINDNNSDVKTIESMLIKQATFSGTTSTQGNLRICNNLTDIILGVKFDMEYIYSAGVWHAGTEQGIHVVETNGETYTEKAVSGTYYYI